MISCAHGGSGSRSKWRVGCRRAQRRCPEPDLPTLLPRCLLAVRGLMTTGSDVPNSLRKTRVMEYPFNELNKEKKYALASAGNTHNAGTMAETFPRPCPAGNPR